MSKRPINYESLETLDSKIKRIQDTYEGALDKIPIWVIGSTYLGLGPGPNGQLHPRWVSVEKIERMVWESALSEAFTFSTLGFSPHFISPVPSDDPMVSGIGIQEAGRRRVEDWKDTWKIKMFPHFVELPGPFPISLYFSTPQGRAQKADPACLKHFSWKHVIDKIKPWPSGPGVLVVNSYFSTQLHKELEKALDRFKDWLVCFDFGRLDRQGSKVGHAIQALLDQFEKVDIQFTSQHDLIELFYQELQRDTVLDHESEVALDRAFRRLQGMPSPAVVLVKTHHQNRRLWLKSRQKGIQTRELPYHGLDLSNIWYPHFGGIFNAAFIVSLLTNKKKAGIKRRAEEATTFALDVLGYCGDELVTDQSKEQNEAYSPVGTKASEKQKGGRKKKVKKKKTEGNPSGVENYDHWRVDFPIQSILKICKKIEKERPEITPLKFLCEYGRVPGLLGFRTCPEVTHAVRMALISDQSILIIGENGTGKGVVARFIHENGHRKDGPFVEVNLAGRTPELQRFELFGSLGGAFTGDFPEPRKGCLETAIGGTVLLNDLQEVSKSALVGLLACTETDPDKRVLQPIGAAHDQNVECIRLDVRYIATVNRFLHEIPHLEKQFIFRLAGIKIFLPPLRHRRDEIRPLAEHFIEKYVRRKTGCPNFRLSDKALEALSRHNWPGNVRELENAMAYAVDACQGTLIEPEHLPDEIRFEKPDGILENARISDDLWKDLRAEERVIVHHWHQVSPILSRATHEDGGVNWSKAAGIMAREQIPLTKVQTERKLKNSIHKLSRGQSIEEVLKLPAESIAISFIEEGEKKRRQRSLRKKKNQ
jgi:DNA-binding NtrC family response regulator